MRSLFAITSSTAALLLVACLSRATATESDLQRQSPFTNDTISRAGSLPLFSSFIKRNTCSGTCAECYGTGSILCGDNETCYNPTIGDSCCGQYDYSCSDGYYCAPGGLESQCCANSVSTSDCTTAINGGGSGGDSGSGGDGSGDGNGNGNGNGSGNNSTSSGLSTGAKAGIGIGVALLLIIIASVVAWLVMRSRSRKRTRVPAGPAAWQMPMPELSNAQGGPGGAPTGYNNPPPGGYGGPQGAYDPPQGGYNTGYDNGPPQGTYHNSSTAYNSPPPGTYNDVQPAYGSAIPNDTKTPAYTNTSTSGGGPPVADVYAPAADGAQKTGYGAFVPSHHAELAETPPPLGHSSYPAQTTGMAPRYGAPPSSGVERAGAAEMYGGGYGGEGR